MLQMASIILKYMKHLWQIRYPTTQKLEKAACDVCGIFLAVKTLSLYRGVVAPHREDSWLFQVGIFERDAAVILLSIPLAGNESFAGAVDASVLLCL